MHEKQLSEMSICERAMAIGDLGLPIHDLAKDLQQRWPREVIAKTLHSYAVGMVISSSGDWPPGEMPQHLIDLVTDNWTAVGQKVAAAFNAQAPHKGDSQ